MYAGDYAGDGYAPDWRDAAAYAPLLDADRALFAWEWLRRDADYRAAAERTFEADSGRDPTEPGKASERWGLHAFERPRLTVPEARPLWCAEVHSYVLTAEAASDDSDAFLLERHVHLVTLVRGTGAEHLLLSDGFRCVRLDARGQPLSSGPVRLTYQIAGLRQARAAVLVLRRFMHLASTGQFSSSLQPREPRAGRFVLMLRAFDALQSGATQREIAAELLSDTAGQAKWRIEVASLRSRAQRLVRDARRMAKGGYLDLLR